MKVVIDISEAEYHLIQKLVARGMGNRQATLILGGLVLPKGHGDLIDREVAKEKMRDAMCGTGYQHIPLSVLDSEFLTPTVIEADNDNEN